MALTLGAQIVPPQPRRWSGRTKMSVLLSMRPLRRRRNAPWRLQGVTGFTKIKCLTVGRAFSTLEGAQSKDGNQCSMQRVRSIEKRGILNSTSGEMGNRQANEVTAAKVTARIVARSN